MEASHQKYILEFKRPSGTSRGVLITKETHFIILKDRDKIGIGECGLLRGLSIDDVPAYEEMLDNVCGQIDKGLTGLLDNLAEFPSIQFGLEQAFSSLQSANPFELFPSDFTRGTAAIPINGLLWMGEEEFLNEQLHAKSREGFKCIKIKVGALDFDSEVRFIEKLRQEYSPARIELRLDANGAFNPDQALEKLKILSRFHIHSIEQPVAKGQFELMAELCKESPIPIALDEELIGLSDVTEKKKLLQTIKPDYIILKPSLIGGIRGSEEWISLAKTGNIGWWITSALESNIGLNAIAQWTYTLDTKMYQGLGTGGLYTNNFESPLQIEKGMLIYRRGLKWQNNLIKDLCS